MKFTKREKSLLLGMVLGDGFLQATGSKNARLRLEHSEDQKDYLLWKVRSLPKLFLGNITRLSRLHPKSLKVYHYVRHQSNSTPILGAMRKHFYPQGKKRIPPELVDELNQQALAIWYMDDGYYYLRDRCAYLYLGNVSRDDAEIAKRAVERFSLEVRVLSKKKGFALYFSPQQALKLKEVIGDYILPYFKYKLPS